MILGIIKSVLVLAAVLFSIYYIVYETDIIEQYLPVRDSVTDTIDDIRNEVPITEDIISTARDALPMPEEEPMVLYAGMPYQVCLYDTCLEWTALGSTDADSIMSLSLPDLPTYGKSPKNLNAAYKIDSGDSVVLCRQDGTCRGPLTVYQGNNTDAQNIREACVATGDQSPICIWWP